MVASPTGLSTAWAIAILVLCAAVRWLGGFERAELPLFDAMVRRLPAPRGADPYVVVVRATEADIQRFGWRSCSDSTLARLLDVVTGAESAVVVVDVFRDSVPAGWKDTSASLVVFPEKLADSASGGVPAPKGMSAGGAVGFTDVLVDADHVVRRALYIASDSGRDYVSLSLQAARGYLAATHAATKETVAGGNLTALGAWTLNALGPNDGGYRSADTRGFQTLFRYAALPSRLSSYTMSEILDGRVPRDSLRGRVVWFGAVSPDLPDIFHLPTKTSLDVATGTPGVAVGALATSLAIRFALGTTQPIRTAPSVALWALLALATLGAGLVASRSSTTRAIVLGLVVGPVALLAVGLIALSSGVWIPVAAPAIGWLVAGGAAAAALTIRNKRERAAVMGLFTRHLSPELAADIWEKRDDFLDGRRPRPRRLPVTVLFADLKGYTAMSEVSDAERLMEWVNEFTNAMASEIMLHGGLVDDYAGDGIKADWGVPIGRDSNDDGAIRADAVRAVRCALAMERRLVALNDAWRAADRPTAAMRIGIASGIGVAGSIGGADRLKYTVVGDVVNLAARLESIDAIPFDPTSRPCRILIDSRANANVSHAIQSESLGEFRVKGRSEPVGIHMVVDLVESAAPTTAAIANGRHA